LCYEEPDGTRTSCVAIQTTPRFEIGEPTVAAAGNYVRSGKYFRQYDITPDGERFLMIRHNPPQPATAFRVIQNWFEELKAKVPISK
jgi:predicted transcriptional regulator